MEGDVDMKGIWSFGFLDVLNFFAWSGYARSRSALKKKRGW